MELPLQSIYLRPPHLACGRERERAQPASPAQLLVLSLNSTRTSYESKALSPLLARAVSPPPPPPQKKLTMKYNFHDPQAHTGSSRRYLPPLPPSEKPVCYILPPPRTRASWGSGPCCPISYSFCPLVIHHYLPSHLPCVCVCVCVLSVVL